MASMSQLTMAMITLYSGDPKRIQHFMKVYAFAKMIAEEEQIGAKQREVIEAAALVHDIGIHAAERNTVLLPENIRNRRRHCPCHADGAGILAGADQSCVRTGRPPSQLPEH